MRREWVPGVELQEFRGNQKMPDQTKNKIIIALDVSTAEEAKEHIRDLQQEVGAFKIGLQLFTSAGSNFVREVVEKGIKLFLDLKFHDIPATVAKASVEVARLGVWMFDIHTSGGSEMIKRTVESVNEVCYKESLRKPKIIGVSVLTSLNRETLKEIGLDGDISSQVLKLAKISHENGLDGVVTSPNEASLIRKHLDAKNFKVVTPGVRLGTVLGDDQERVMTPRGAVESGSDYLVIGRPILHANDKLEAVSSIIKNVESLNSR